MKILLTGASGFIGWNFCHAYQNDYQITGVVHRHWLDMPGVDIRQADLTDYSLLKNLFQDVEPDAVIHLASLSSPNTCAENPNVSRRMNVEGPVNLAGLCSDRKIPCVFTSTDLVFGGDVPPYRETDSVNPANRYGEHKAIAEEEMLSRYPQTAVCRLSLVFGFPGPYSSNFFIQQIHSLDKEKHLTLFTDEIRTMISVRAVMEGILLAMEKVRGILHLGGRERLSRYEFGQQLARTFSYDHARLVRCSQEDISMAASRPADVSLDSSKARQLGFNPWPVEKELEYLYKGHTSD